MKPRTHTLSWQPQTQPLGVSVLLVSDPKRSVWVLATREYVRLDSCRLRKRNNCSGRWTIYQRELEGQGFESQQWPGVAWTQNLCQRSPAIFPSITSLYTIIFLDVRDTSASLNLIKPSKVAHANYVLFHFIGSEQQATALKTTTNEVHCMNVSMTFWWTKANLAENCPRVFVALKKSLKKSNEHYLIKFQITLVILPAHCNQK